MEKYKLIVSGITYGMEDDGTLIKDRLMRHETNFYSDNFSMLYQKSVNKWFEMDKDYYEDFYKLTNGKWILMEQYDKNFDGEIKRLGRNHKPKK